jgi:hypothetical protein
MNNYLVAELHGRFDVLMQAVSLAPREQKDSNHFMGVAFEGAALVPLTLAAVFVSALIFASSSGTIFFTLKRAR